MNKKIFLIAFIFALMFIPLVNAERVDDAQQNKEIQLTNYCEDGTCSYMNLISIELPNKTIIYPNAGMTKNGQTFNYTYTPTLLGTYTFKTCGNPSGMVICNSDTFESTPSGNSGMENTVFFILIIALLYGLTLLFFFKRIAPLTALTGMAMVFLGIYIINNGILIFRDDLTNYVAYITSFLGGGIAIWAIIEWIQDMM